MLTETCGTPAQRDMMEDTSFYTSAYEISSYTKQFTNLGDDLEIKIQNLILKNAICYLKYNFTVKIQ
jgi:hypothetical protein